MASPSWDGAAAAAAATGITDRDDGRDEPTSKAVTTNPHTAQLYHTVLHGKHNPITITNIIIIIIIAIFISGSCNK